MYKDLLHFTKQKLNNNNIATVKVLFFLKKLKCNSHTNGNEDVPNSYNSIIKMQKEKQIHFKRKFGKAAFYIQWLKKKVEIR